MIGRDFAGKVEATIDVVPEGPGRDNLRKCAAALREKPGAGLATGAQAHRRWAR